MALCLRPHSGNRSCLSVADESMALVLQGFIDLTLSHLKAVLLSVRMEAIYNYV